MQQTNPWTPGQRTLHRLLTAAALACVPPADDLLVRIAYWGLLLLHAAGRLPWLTLHSAVGLWFLALRPQIALALFLLGAFATLMRRAWRDHPSSMRGAAFMIMVPAWWRACGVAEAPDSLAAVSLFTIGLAYVARRPAVAWCVMIVVGAVFALRDAAPPVETWILHALAFSPAWIPRRRAGLPLTVFYDGECGFCHRSVQFLMKEDPDGAAMRFAPLQGTTFAARVPKAERAHLPDSIVVSDATGALLVRSAAALRIGAALGGYWRPLAALAWIVPRPLRDAVYDAIARRRQRWFAKPDAHCPLLSPAQRARFDP